MGDVVRGGGAVVDDVGGASEDVVAGKDGDKVAEIVGIGVGTEVVVIRSVGLTGGAGVGTSGVAKAEPEVEVTEAAAVDV